MSEKEKGKVVEQELKRVIQVIEKTLDAGNILITEEIFFREELIPYIEGMYPHGVIYSFRCTVGSFQFNHSTKKQKIHCLNFFRENFMRIIEDGNY